MHWSIVIEISGQIIVRIIFTTRLLSDFWYSSVYFLILFLFKFIFSVYFVTVLPRLGCGIMHGLLYNSCYYIGVHASCRHIRQVAQHRAMEFAVPRTTAGSCLVPCGRQSWLPVSFWAHILIVSQCRYKFKLLKIVHYYHHHHHHHHHHNDTGFESDGNARERRSRCFLYNGNVVPVVFTARCDA